jgi:hypothetical protein
MTAGRTGKAPALAASDDAPGSPVDWWAPARDKFLAKLERQERAGRITPEGHDNQYFAAFGVAWVPDRPAPWLPSMWKIVQYWADRNVFQVDPEHPHCFACQATVPDPGDDPDPEGRWIVAGGWLEKGHLVNRCCYGLDRVQNLVPLCYACNRSMPVFDSPGPPSPVDWVLRGGWTQYCEPGPDGVLRYARERFQHSVTTLPAWNAISLGRTWEERLAYYLT